MFINYRNIGYYLLVMFTFSPFLAFLLRTSLNVALQYAANFFLILGLFSFFLTKDKKVVYPKYMIFFLVFVVYTIFSDIFIAGKPLDLKYLYSNSLLASVIIFFFVENGNYNEKEMDRYKLYNIIILFIAVVVILFQQAINENFFVSELYKEKYFFDSLYSARLPSIYSYVGSSIVLGFCFVPILSFIIAEKIKNDENFIIIVIFMLLGAIYSFFVKYRWIMLNFSLLFFLFPIYKRFWRKKGVILVFTIFVFGAISFTVLNALGIPLISFINERILERSAGGMMQGSASTRLLAFEIFFKIFPQNPIFGAGLMHGQSETGGDMQLLMLLRGRSSQIHVGYLSLLYYYGIVGSIPFILFLVSLSKKLYRDAMKHNNWGILIGFVGYILANVTLVTFHLFYSGIIIIIIYNKFLLQKSIDESIRST